jgi:hypothetical protein
MATNKKCGYCKEYGHYKTTCPNIDTNKECSICYSTLSKIKNSILTPCGHCFCFKCFMKWNEEHETCPYCRKHISKKTTIIEYIEIDNDVIQEVIVYPSFKQYMIYILHETFAWSKINKDNLIISILIIMYFILYFMKLSHNKIDYEINN